MTLHVIARFTARPETLDSLRTLLTGLVEPIRGDKGCIRCALTTSVQNPAEFNFIEEWADQAAIDEHLKDPSIQAAVNEALALLAMPFQLHLYQA